MAVDYPSPQATWEYKVVPAGIYNSEQTRQTFLDGLGIAGWELVFVVD